MNSLGSLHKVTELRENSETLGIKTQHSKEGLSRIKLSIRWKIHRKYEVMEPEIAEIPSGIWCLFWE